MKNNTLIIDNLITFLIDDTVFVVGESSSCDLDMPADYELVAKE